MARIEIRYYDDLGNIKFEYKDTDSRSTRRWYLRLCSVCRIIKTVKLALFRNNGLTGGNYMTQSDKKKFVVAHYLLVKNTEADRKGFTNKKLQKLMFYAQAWSLVLNNRKLIDDKFEAWVHGAAIPALYGHYKKHGFADITDEVDISEFDILDVEDKKLLDLISEVYGKYDADYLELLNHSEQPWQKARQGVQPYESSSAVISEDDMKQFYGEKLGKVTS